MRMAYGDADSAGDLGGNGSGSALRDYFTFDVPALQGLVGPLRHPPRMQAVLDRRNTRLMTVAADGELRPLAAPSDGPPRLGLAPAWDLGAPAGAAAAVVHIDGSGAVRDTSPSGPPAQTIASGQPVIDAVMAPEASGAAHDEAAGGEESAFDARVRTFRARLRATRALPRLGMGAPEQLERAVADGAAPASPPLGPLESAVIWPRYSRASALAALATRHMYEPTASGREDDAHDFGFRDAHGGLRERQEPREGNPQAGGGPHGFLDRRLNPMAIADEPAHRPRNVSEAVGVQLDMQPGSLAAHVLNPRTDALRARDFEAPINPDLNATPEWTAYQEAVTHAQARAANSSPPPLASPSGLVYSVAHRFGLQAEGTRMHSLPDLVPLSDEDEEESSQMAVLNATALQRSSFRPCSVAGAGDLPSVLSSKFLSPGFKFVGKQCFKSEQACVHESIEDWTVRVEIVRLNWEAGRICGVMTANGLPQQNEPIVTYWEGEVVDNRNASFNSAHFDVAESTDLQHWGKFPSFQALRGTLQGPAMVCPLLHSSRGVFMRWKEQEFLAKPRGREMDLTIAGFYYVCLDRATGEIDGFYHDPKSTPFQRLTLRPERQGLGVAFGDVMCS